MNRDEEKIIGQEKYFVHKGTWKNDYEWRIQKVKITGLKVDENNDEYLEFSFACTGYEYPRSWLKNTFEEAQKFAVEKIIEEKERQIKSINESRAQKR